MANRAYFINHAEASPVSLDSQRGRWLLAASYQIPIFGSWMIRSSSTPESRITWLHLWRRLVLGGNRFVPKRHWIVLRLLAMGFAGIPGMQK
jgi:hypothetical protein